MVEAPPTLYPRLVMARRSKPRNEKPTIPGTFGHWMREQRTRPDRDWSQPEFAALVDDGMTAGEVSVYEGGKRLPQVPRMLRIASVFGESWLEVLRIAYPEIAGMTDGVPDSEGEETRAGVRRRWRDQRASQKKQPLPFPEKDHG